MMRLTSVS